MKYIYIIIASILISWCSINNTNTTSTNSWSIESWSILSWDLIEDNSILQTGAKIWFGNASWLQNTKISTSYSNPLYEPIEWCNRESREQQFGKYSIYMLVMNCKLEDGYYTVNPYGSGSRSEDKYTNNTRQSNNTVMQIFNHSNINNMDNVITTWYDQNNCEFRMVFEDNTHQERELLTKDAYTEKAEYELELDNTYLPCWEYWYTQLWRNRFTIFKNQPDLAFFSRVWYEYPLFDPNTIIIK